MTNLIVFCDWTIAWIVDWSTMDIVYVDFNTAFDTLSQDVVISKLRNHGLTMLMDSEMYRSG